MSPAFLTRKGGVALLAVLGAVVVIVTATRTWVTGTVDDAVLGASRLSATGSEVATGVVALALVAGAAAVATTTSGRLVRRVTLAVLALSAVGVVAQVLRVVLAPGTALGPIAARATGRGGSLETHSTATAWPWVALLGAALLLLAGAGALAGMRRWSALSSRYETPAGTDVRGARGERVASDWDRLSAGDDPTAAEHPASSRRRADDSLGDDPGGADERPTGGEVHGSG